MTDAIATRLAARWRILTVAPHRMFFFSGLAWLLAWSAGWAFILVARASGAMGLEPAIPALLLHGATMLYLVLPPFMYGFLLTVFPRWMTAPQPGRAAMLWAFGLVNAGNLCALLGAAGVSYLLLAGWLLATVALAMVGAVLLNILLRAGDRAAHALTVLAGIAAGVFGMVLFAHVLAGGDFSTWPLVRSTGLWGFLLVIYFSVCHRMVPFFTFRIVPGYVSWRPDWILYLFVALALARGVLELVPDSAWFASVPLAMIGVTCAFRWRPRQRTGVRLLDVLHISVAWLAAGLALAAAADIAAAVGAPGLVGRAPLHALGMGFMGGMLMAMVTRVTLGHAGRPLVLSTVDWRLFLLIQGATLLRVAAEFLPPAAAGLSLAAALAWLAAFGAWTIGHLPIYLRSRADGAPG